MNTVHCFNIQAINNLVDYALQYTKFKKTIYTT